MEDLGDLVQGVLSGGEVLQGEAGLFLLFLQLCLDFTFKKIFSFISVPNYPHFSQEQEQEEEKSQLQEHEPWQVRITKRVWKSFFLKA